MPKDQQGMKRFCQNCFGDWMFRGKTTYIFTKRIYNYEEEESQIF